METINRGTAIGGARMRAQPSTVGKKICLSLQEMTRRRFVNSLD